MKLRILAFGIMAAGLLAGCTVAPRSFTVDNGCFELELNDPAAPDPDGAFGCRFLRPGWITGLWPAGSGESVFHTRTLYGHHPAFGCTQEIVPELELAPGRQLKIGVGVIEPNPVNRFRASPVELFPWSVEFERTRGRAVMTARQSSGRHSGYAYELTVTVTVTGGSPEIVMKQELWNTGVRRFAGAAYLHPFFRVRERESCRFRLPGGASGRVFDMPESVEEKYEASDGARLLRAVFRTDRECAVTVAADRPLSAGRLWHNGKNCFSVEPFIAVNIAPGERREWTWRLEVGSGRIR
ncbi:MAG: hypothetical protein HPZ91_12485 [Lentisphaeria bacterium]|nr:hypothetical protein [Lentisphaeria bacterium]